MDKYAHIKYMDIVKSYGSKRAFKVVLKGVNIELTGGECTLISGKNGSGKSTLLRIMAGLLKPDSALVNTGLETLPWRKYRKIIRQQIMYLYQEPYMFDGTVSRNLCHALQGKCDTNKIKRALEWADLSEHADTQAKCLSGGERQRVALAQAWLKQPGILLLDEPTANMDEHAKRRTEALLYRFKETGIALFIASHDLYHFNRVLDKRLLLQDGHVSELDAQTTHDSRDHCKNILVFPQR